jgi:hypothetical protein
MLRHVSSIRTSATAITCFLVLCSLPACANKRFVPRIVSESVVIRDAARVPDARIVTGPLTLERVQIAPPASKVTVGPRRSQRGAVGTSGFGEREWKGSVEETFGATFESAPAASQPAAAPQPAPPAPVRTTLASMGDGGVILAIVAVGCALGAFIYRYRVY